MGFVRVVIPESGVHATVSEEWAESAGLKTVDEPALSESGAPRSATDKDGNVLGATVIEPEPAKGAKK